MTVEKNKTYEVTVADMGANGMGVCKIATAKASLSQPECHFHPEQKNGFAVFVPAACQDDVLEIVIVKVKKNFAFGKIKKIIHPSENRAVPLCPVFLKCGGCQLQHIKYPYQLRCKTKIVKDALERIAKISIPVEETIGMTHIYHYRNKAAFPVKKGKDGIAIGFFRERSHDIIDATNCPIGMHHNRDIVEVLKQFMEAHSLAPYDEAQNKGIIRHLMTRTASNGQIMVILVINAKGLPHADDFVSRLSKIKNIASIIVNQNLQKTNVILGKKCKTIWGDDVLYDVIDNLKFSISPHSFFQVNDEGMHILYQKALMLCHLSGHETVVDLYCGVGTISLYLARYCKQVYGIEYVEDAVEDAKKNAALNNITNAAFFHGAAEEILRFIHSSPVHVVVLDPPRKGCDQPVLDCILQMAPTKIIYISCNPATLSRDLITLQQNYVVEQVCPVDIFPMTSHVETVVSMTRLDGP